MFRIRASIIFVFFFFSAILCLAGKPDTIHVYTHNKLMVITDPAKGIKTYTSWGVFPSKETQIRKIILTVTFQKPDSLKCGEWDYVDNVFLRRTGGKNQPSKDFEIARLITPYGWFFEKGWKFSWDVDVTDFSLFLRDSVEIEYAHSGYEDNKDRGWVVTLDFKVIKGKPVANPIGITKLCEGNFPYGDSLNDIEKNLKPFPFTVDKNTYMTRLRIIQTGHGMDEYQNCAEFCSKYREIIFDNKLIDKKDIWLKCGKNPLSPQAGTWIFDRANWCPGCMVKPETYDFFVEPGSKHVIDVNMQPYKVPMNPTAVYCFYSYLISYGKVNATNDVSVEDIMVPSVKDIYKHLNPAGSDAKIIIKNNGKDPVKKLTIKHGTAGFSPQIYNWTGYLLFGQTAEIVFKGSIQMKDGLNQYEVTILNPNDKNDEYPKDNMMTSAFVKPPVYAGDMILFLRTNNQPDNNFYYLMDETGNKLAEHKPGSLKSNTDYRDTLKLTDGNYSLVVCDTAGDGLEFWFNTEGGRGIVRLMDAKGIMLKNFDSDFGSELLYNFVVNNQYKNSADSISSVPAIGVFPTRTKGNTAVDYFNNKAMDVLVQITSESGVLVEEHKYINLKEGIFNFNLTNQPRGRYYIKVFNGNNSFSKRIRLID